MAAKDLILAILVVIVWGANFTFIRLGLDGVPSMLLVAARYLVVIPAVFFVKKPNISLKLALAYGSCVGVIQFSCLFYAMQIGMPAGLSSIVLQSAAFITPLLAMFLLKESMKPVQFIGLFIAAGGLYFIAKSSMTGSITSIPLFGLLLTLLAAFFWALSNIIIKIASNKASEKGEKLDMLGVVVWTSLIPPIPALAFAFLLDSPETIYSAVTNLSPISVFSIAYLGLGSTLFGYGMWSSLLSKYPASKIAPLSLMVPITGLITARLVLDERLSYLQWIGGMIIIIGLAFSTLAGQIIYRQKE